MPDNRQTKALAKLEQIKRLAALAEHRRVAAAQAKVAEVQGQIDGIDTRIAGEIAVFTDYTDTPALSRWAGMMEDRREVLVSHRIMEERVVAALAEKAAEADMEAEQHKELLKHLRKKLAEEKRRARERAEWEQAAILFGLASPLDDEDDSDAQG